MPAALIINAAGINCDAELGRAFELAGADAEFIHLNRLMDEPELIQRFDLIGLPGGFSYGDAIAAGRIMAALIRQRLYRPLVEAVERGVPIFAPCNGFQIAVQAGLLPGPAPGEPWPDDPPKPSASLGVNTSGRFVDRWTRIEFPSTDRSRCIWTRHIRGNERTLILPNAHGEGRFIVADDDLIAQLEENGQIALRYHADDNFNGSSARIAGICDASGLIFGLMPHPERYTRWELHPFWTRLTDGERAGEPPGLQIFRNAVEYVAEQKTAADIAA
jgi:phosphoribosylformylglycinamidine synthase I